MKKQISFWWICSLILMAIPAWLSASEVKAGEKVVIQQPVSGNLYLAGGEITIDAPIGGDLVAAGGKITINQPISDEGLLAGGEITLNAEINGDLRVAGGKVLIKSNIQGDLVVAGGDVVIDSDVIIRGDLLVFSGKVVVNGTVGGSVRGAGGEFILNGRVEGGAEFNGGLVVVNGEIRGSSTLAAEKIVFGAGSRFYSDLRYWREEGKADLSNQMQNGARASFDESLQVKSMGGFDKEAWQRGWFLFSVYRFVAGIVMILLLVFAFHRFFTRYAGKLGDNLTGYFGSGTLYLLGIPVLAFLALITIIGIPVAFILVAGYGVSLALAGSLIATALAYEVNKQVGRNWSRGMMVLVAIGISLLLRLLVFIPVVGWLTWVLLMAVVFGYLIQNFRTERRLRRQVKTGGGGDPDIV